MKIMLLLMQNSNKYVKRDVNKTGRQAESLLLKMMLVRRQFLSKGINNAHIYILPWACLSWGINHDRTRYILGGKATVTSGLRLGRSEVLRSLRHYLQAQSQRRHTIDRMKERGVGRGNARRPSLKGREWAIVS